MRLNKHQIQVIKTQTALVFGVDAKVYLFGSRVYDEKKGGDIDLLILTDNSNVNQRNNINLLYVNLILKLGDQKIDIVSNSPYTNPSIITTALQTGIQL